jgi:hypothetical protein
VKVNQMAPSSDQVSNDLCEARMQTIAGQLSEILANQKETMNQLRSFQTTQALMDVKVEDHDRFLTSLKTWGLRILYGLACVALGGGTIAIKDLIK